MLDGIGDVPRIILAYVTGFGFISGVWFIYAGFRKQIRRKTLLGLFWVSLTWGNLIEVIHLTCWSLTR